MHIYIDILRLIHKKNNRAKPTHILYGANLSHIRLKKYLANLLDMGFIEEIHDNEHTYFVVTEKGYEFLREFRKIEEMSEAFGIPL